MVEGEEVSGGYKMALAVEVAVIGLDVAAEAVALDA